MRSAPSVNGIKDIKAETANGISVQKVHIGLEIGVIGIERAPLPPPDPTG
jgi:hypothetical protein